jgi:hypothetical protein
MCDLELKDVLPDVVIRACKMFYLTEVTRS